MIRAAGGVVVRDGRVAVVHRPRHDDWSLPKGHVEAGESWEAAALREVEEECGLRCALDGALPASAYAVDGEPKEVRWWRMRVVEDVGFTPDEECDELRWCTPAQADALLSYAADRDLVRAAFP